MKTVVIVNPAAGKRVLIRWLLPHVLRALEARGLELVVCTTRYEGHAAALVRRWAPEVDFVTVVGGDGTIGEAVRGMTEHMLPLAIIPFGTANVLAVELGIPLNPFLAVDVVIAGRERWIDLGFVNDRPFLLMVSAGIDAYTVHRLAGSARRSFGKLAYVVRGLAAAFTYRARRVRISLETQGIRDEGYYAIVANSRYYGGRISLEPAARIDDGLLNVMLFKSRSILDMLRLLLGVLTGTHKRMPDVATYQDRSVRLHSNRSIYMQTDGDKVPFTDALITVRKRCLPVRVPRIRGAEGA